MFFHFIWKDWLVCQTDKLWKFCHSSNYRCHSAKTFWSLENAFLKKLEYQFYLSCWFFLFFSWSSLLICSSSSRVRREKEDKKARIRPLYMHHLNAHIQSRYSSLPSGCSHHSTFNQSLSSCAPPYTTSNSSASTYSDYRHGLSNTTIDCNILSVSSKSLCVDSFRNRPVIQ